MDGFQTPTKFKEIAVNEVTKNIRIAINEGIGFFNRVRDEILQGIIAVTVLGMIPGITEFPDRFFQYLLLSLPLLSSLISLSLSILTLCDHVHFPLYGFL